MIRNTPVLKTERLILRPFTEADLGALFHIYSDDEVNKYLPWFPLKTMDEAIAFFIKEYAMLIHRFRLTNTPSAYRKTILPLDM